jgi:hypothetical protein
MIEGNWIEVTGLANAAYRHDVVLPACERRAAQRQVLTATADAQTNQRRMLPVWRWRGLRRSSQGMGGRTTTTALPDA